MAHTRTFGYVRWECDRCHRDVVIEDVTVAAVHVNFDVRCPICELLVRFVMPPLRALDALAPDDTMSLTRSLTTVDEVH